MRPRRLQSVLSAIYNIIAAFPWPLFIDILVNVVLVANKVDLAPQREVSTQEGQHLAQRWGCAFFEASAKTRTNVDEVPATHPRTHWSKAQEQVAQTIALAIRTCVRGRVQAFFEVVRKIRAVEGMPAPSTKPVNESTRSKRNTCSLF